VKYKKAESEEYLNYGWVREMFELMVLNALTFNRYVSLAKTHFVAPETSV